MSLNGFLADYPSTNARLATSVCLDIAFVLTVLGGMILRIDMDSNVIWSLGTFLLVLSGLDATQFNIKRKTEIVTPPQTTAENATATTSVSTTAQAKIPEAAKAGLPVPPIAAAHSFDPGA
jgi:hypothetical protein